MRLGKDLTGKPIISVTDGRFIGNVKDIYVDKSLSWMTGIYLGHEGLIKRKYLLVPRDQVAVFGIDAILVKESDVITTTDELAESEAWLRLEKLRGRDVDTPGGTKVGTVGDIIIGTEGDITGFTLGRVYVEGPIAAQGQIPRGGLVDTGSEDGAMTVDLAMVESLLHGGESTPSAEPVNAEAAEDAEDADDAEDAEDAEDAFI